MFNKSAISGYHFIATKSDILTNQRTNERNNPLIMTVVVQYNQKSRQRPHVAPLHLVCPNSTKSQVTAQSLSRTSEWSFSTELRQPKCSMHSLSPSASPIHVTTLQTSLLDGQHKSQGPSLHPNQCTQTTPLTSFFLPPNTILNWNICNLYS